MFGQARSAEIHNDNANIRLKDIAKRLNG